MDYINQIYRKRKRVFRIRRKEILYIRRYISILLEYIDFSKIIYKSYIYKKDIR